MSSNRFASLYMDDDDDEKVVAEEAKVEPVPLPEPTFVPSGNRSWNKDEAVPEKVRDWNLEKKRKYRQPFSKGYAFHDDEPRPKFIPLKAYAFQDDPAPESVKPNSPVEGQKTQLVTCRKCGGEHWTLSCKGRNSVKKSSPLNPNSVAQSPKVNTESQEDFPKLSDYNRPMTPPYPPDDGDYPTFAERVKRSIEKETEDRFKPIEPVPVLEMMSVIPMRTTLIGKLSLS